MGARVVARGRLGVAAAINVTPLVFVLYLLRRERAAAAIGARHLRRDHRPPVARPAGRLVDLLAPRIVHPGRSAGAARRRTSPGGASCTAPGVRRGGLRTLLWVLASVVTVALAAYVARRCVDGGRRCDALVAVAIAGLLVSPVSWTHHWSWVALVALLLLERGVRHGACHRLHWRCSSCSRSPAPYAWHGRGPAMAPLNFTLVAAGALLLVVMAVVERRERPRRGAATPAVTAAARAASTPVADP